MKKEFIINQNTLYLEYQEEMLVIHELSTIINIENKSMKSIIDQSCIYYGSSFAGRLKSSKDYLKENYKLPIIINESHLLIAFPLNSLRTQKSIWLIYNNIDKYYQISKSKVLVEFIGGKVETFPVSYYIFHNQVLKCSRLIVIYQSRN